MAKDKHETFVSLGFTSFMATELMLQIEHLVVKPGFSIVQYVLSDDGTVEGLLSALNCLHQTSVITCNTVTEEHLSVLDYVSQSTLCWDYYMEKCIDATPVVSKK